MENQSGHPHQSAPNKVHLHASSSDNTASIQMLTQPYQPEPDGYSWRLYDQQQVVPGCSFPTIHYVCTEVNWEAQKSVERSADGQIVETVLMGTHNHPSSSDRRARVEAVRFGQCSQDNMRLEVSAATGASVTRTSEAGEEFSSSSDSEEDDDGELGADGDTAGDTKVIEIQSETRRSKSKVWEQFTAVLSGGKVQGAECKHCKTCLSEKSSGSTSHLRRHLKICPAQPARDRVHQQRSSSHPDSFLEKNWKFDQIELLTMALFSDLCSFSLTRSTMCRQFLAGIRPGYELASERVIGEKFLDIFQDKKSKLKEEIALAPGGVFLAVAKWVLESRNFICLTLHFIDKDWKMDRKIIRCTFIGDDDEDARYYVSMFPDWSSYFNMVSSDDKATAAVVRGAVQDWGLEGKVLGISLPKSLTGGATFELEENLAGQNYLLAKCKLLTLPCIVDALHDLFGYSIKDFVLQTCQDWFSYMTCSRLRINKYREIVSQLPINQPTFGSRKWHLTFYLLEAALQFNKVLPNLEQIDPRYFPSKPSRQKLEAAENFCDLARLIYRAIEVVSSPYYKLSSYFHAIWNLKIAMLDSSRKVNINHVFDIQEMQVKVDKLWNKWYLWLSLGVVLDPRYKIRYLEFHFKQCFGSDAKRYILEVRGKIYELFLRYSFHTDQQSGESLDCNSDLEFDARGHGSFQEHYTRQTHIEQAANKELGELTAYLEDELIPASIPFDILKWWMDNTLMYPTLARLARDILVIPGCTVSIESAFSETDERADLFCRKIRPEVVEALICTQDWIKS